MILGIISLIFPVVFDSILHLLAIQPQGTGFPGSVMDGIFLNYASQAEPAIVWTLPQSLYHFYRRTSCR